jgi:hypothetical protein
MALFYTKLNEGYEKYTTKTFALLLDLLYVIMIELLLSVNTHEASN